MQDIAKKSDKVFALDPGQTIGQKVKGNHNMYRSAGTSYFNGLICLISYCRINKKKKIPILKKKIKLNFLNRS